MSRVLDFFRTFNDMALTSEQILTLQGIKGFGTGTVQKICAEAENHTGQISSINDLHDLCLKLADSKVLTRVAPFSFDDFERACSGARRILDSSESLGIKVASRYEASYPKKLLSTLDEMGRPSAPILVFYKGNLEVTEMPGIAIIGTRKPTPDGVRAGEYYAEAFAAAGTNVISGLALGCDAAAHRGALSAGGATTAILANGLDSVYPSENAYLADEILANGGLLISENPVGTSANKYNLVARDRLQAGLADATLVVQSSVKGGTMHAVNATLKSGKVLYAITFKHDQGFADEGNRYLISEKGACSMRSSKEEIISSPELFLPLCGSTKEPVPVQLDIFSGMELN